MFRDIFSPLPIRLKGFYSDCYFSKTKQAAAKAGRNPLVNYQIFQKRQNAVLAGVEVIRHMLRHIDCRVLSLPEGSLLESGKPVMVLQGRADELLEIETFVIGTLARMTRIATNVRGAVEAAKGKPVLFFPARFDIMEAQMYDGYAAAVGGASGCATPAQTMGFNRFMAHSGQSSAEPKGTQPHAALCIFEGDTIAASLAVAEAYPDEPVWHLADFYNDCATDAVAVLKAFRERGIEGRLAGVRLDTSERLVDAGYQLTLGSNETALPSDRGVCEGLVCHIRKALDAVGGQKVKIAVSGGFSPVKIERFEANNIPADVYAVGEYFLSGANAFTADIVEVNSPRAASVTGWMAMHKIGRPKQDWSALEEIKNGLE